MSSLILFLLLSLSMHASDGRHLSSNIKGSSITTHNSSKDTERVKVDEASVPLKPMKGEGETVERSKSSETAVMGVEEMRETVSGSEVLMPSSHSGLPQTTQTKVGSGMRVRSLLGFGSSEETVETGKSVVVADVEVIDYQCPQPGPSTHNK